VNPSGRSCSLYEPFAGSAAVGLRALGIDRTPFPWRGAKTFFADDTLTVLAPGPVEHVHLSDAGLPGVVWGTLLASGPAVVAALEEVADTLCEETWRRLADEPVPDDPARFAATYILLMAGVVGAKPVSVRDGRWRTAGYASLSPLAVQKGFRQRFSPARLAARVAKVIQSPGLRRVTARRCDVREALPAGRLDGDVVYLDPPYGGGYPDDCPLDVVLDIARDAKARGARVGVAFDQPLDLPGARATSLHRRGWQKENFAAGSGKQEWLTCL
jgi:hypothetical protein